ncbi:MAG: pyridoxal-phosphate dependent enzyme, partial [Bdellovibrionales bacterium]|nr:pyridoxal-phosphate dependent enzyme [Bdellovibrionales bacterium]
MSKEVNIDEIKLAKQRVADQLPVTSLTRSIGFSELFNTNAFFKWDSLFTTGSFKERGACNFLHLLPADKRKQGVCAASAGNHALALSKYSALLDIPCTLVMPYGAPLVKIESAKAFGADVKLFGETFHHAYEHALTLSSDLGTTFVPAYDHIDIIN